MYVHLSVALHRPISMNASIQSSHFNRQHEVQRKHSATNTHVRRQKKRSALCHFTIHRNCFPLLHAYYCIICYLCINIPELDWQLAPCAKPENVHFSIGVRTVFFLGSSRYISFGTLFNTLSLKLLILTQCIFTLPKWINKNFEINKWRSIELPASGTKWQSFLISVTDLGAFEISRIDLF